MRLDRFITLNLVQPFRHAFCGVSSLVTRHSSLVTSLPILMYHSISDDPELGVRPYYRVCTSPQRFREQMQWLKDNGYRGVTLSDGLAALGSANRKQKIENRNPKSEIGNRQSAIEASPSRPVVITFDDGFRDFCTTAWPILQQYGFAATVFLPTAFIGETRRRFSPRNSSRLSTFNSQPSTALECLTWNEIQELRRCGIEFGSHTVHHPELVDLPWPQIQCEIADSKTQIENQLGAPVRTFAYPYAFPEANRDFVGRLKDLLVEDGYETCVTTQIGRHRAGADPLQIKRLPVNSGDDVRLFQAKMEGCYDWLALPQRIIKKLKRYIPSLAEGKTRSTQPMRSFEPITGH